MKTMLILLMSSAALLLAPTASAYAIVTAGGGSGPVDCNGVVAHDCTCPTGYGSATCRDGEHCEYYVWAVWPECIIGS